MLYSVANAKTQSTGTLWEHCDGFQHLPKGKGIPSVFLSQRNEIEVQHITPFTPVDSRATHTIYHLKDIICV